MTHSSRRSVLSIAATCIAVPSIASACLPVAPKADQADDPIFAAIDRYAEAARICDAAQDGPEDAAGDAALSVAIRAVCAARLDLACTVPTTGAGLAFYARFLNEQSARIFDEPFFDDKASHLAFYDSLDRALTALTRRGKLAAA